MRFVVILLVSFVLHTSAQVLQVKCGDEKCERPSNRAVTTLRYTPDKPYKLQIYAVNSEVEIFGMTDDLYYIRHGKNYGFLPKNHLREKARGNYPFQVEIDLSTRRIDQQVREQNFLFEFLKSSQPQVADVNINETIAAPALNETQPSEDSVASANDKPQDVPLDAPAVVKTDVNSEQQPQAAVESEESDNDSGIDEDDEDEDEEDSEEATENYLPGSVPKVEEDQQPELIAIPPGKDTDTRDSSNEVLNEEEKEPLALPIAASATEEVNPQFDTAENSTVENPQKPVETIPEFVPIKNDAVEQAGNILQVQNETEKAIPEAVETQKVPEEKIFVAPQVIETPKIEEVKADIPQPPSVTEPPVVEKIPEPTVEKIPDPVVEKTPEPTVEKIPEPVIVTTPAPVVEKTPELIKDKVPEPVVEKIPERIVETTPAPVAEKKIEPAPVNEEISELPLNNIQQQEQVLVPEVHVEAEIIAPPTAVKEPEVQTTPQPPQIQIPIAPEVPAIVETLQQKVVAPEPTPIPVLKKPAEPDALLKRFNEKLGHRIVEGTGKGSVESLHKPEDHSHHGHDHSHHGHDHSHHGHDHHHHEEKAPTENVEKLPEDPQAQQEEEKPGFFAGLFSSFFSDKDDSEQHFHETGTAENVENVISTTTEKSAEFCEKIDSENCPHSLKVKRESNFGQVEGEWKSADEYMKIILNEIFESMDLIISLALTSLTVLIFTLGYYCISKARKEGPLIAKMNELERHLMASTKENEILKGDVIATKQKLMSIEDNSFGSNDMVIALKQDLEESEQMKNELMDKVLSLEKELEAAAEDGLELNRMVSELLNNQTGSESIISSVEDLQRQLNEQQDTIMTMTDTLAAKSRENSELQIQLSENNGKFNGEFQNFQQNLDAITLERTNLQIELENLKRDSDLQVNQLIEERNGEVTRLNSELTSYAKSYEEAKKSLNGAESKVQALEECMKAVKKDSKGGEFKDLFDIADLKADLLAVTKEKSTIQEQLQNDKDSRKLLEDRVKLITEEMSTLKKEFGVAEKEKLEAQTRLEVLSTYFKEKETQLQQDLSVKEARWMKQQGETTSTVEKVQALNDEIQTLKSQNDALRVEIEAQVAAHKLNISSHETQSHAAWLNARQAERRLEESRMEAAALRRRLTSIAENPAGASDLLNGLPSMINETMNSIPSPIRVESPNNANPLPPAPMMMPPFLPQGFLPGAPPPFLPPPPFMPGQDMMGMGPPLGRLMSPPPKRFTPTMRDDRNRYSPRGRSGRYSPDSRYDDYTAFETETDYSPPPSPSPPPRRGFNSQSDRSKKSKGGQSSTGSLESNPTSRRK